MNYRITIFLFLYVVLGTSQTSAQWALGELNLAHQYDPDSEISLYCQPVSQTDSLHLFVNLKIRQDKPQLQDYNFDIYLINSTNEKLLSPISKTLIDSTHLYSQNKNHGLQFKLANRSANWVVIRVMSRFSGFSFYFEFPLSANTNPNFSISKSRSLVISPFITSGKYETDQSVLAFYYSHEFSNAVPPMVTRAPLPEKEMIIDSIFNISAYEQFSLEKKGLYFFQSDTSKTNGLGIRLEQKYYPELATLDHLKAPLVYITTKNEKEKLDNMSTKKEFDKFWLDLTSSKERAVKIIKGYYDRVEQANAFFTSFKEGWKTDRGMIYIIYGLPDEVIKSDNEEKWVYLSNTRLPKVTFKFLKADNIFSSSHYVLIRDKKYDDVWFNAIDLWRKSRF